MIICIDIGNTRIKWGIFENGTLRESHAALHAEAERAMRLSIGGSAARIRGVGVCNVGRKSLPGWLPEMFPGQVIREAGFHPSLPLKNGYGTPETLGADRYLAALGALEHAGHGPLLVFDAGTALTWEWVDAEDTYRGGGIAPGLQMRLKALHTFTEKLPLLPMPDTAPPLTGPSTTGSILSGVVNGTLAEIEGIILRYRAQCDKDFPVYLTGGDSSFLANHLKNVNFVRPSLLLEGIYHSLKNSIPDA